MIDLPNRLLAGINWQLKIPFYRGCTVILVKFERRKLWVKDGVIANYGLLLEHI